MCFRLAYEIPCACLLAIILIPIRSAPDVNPMFIASYSRFDVMVCTVAFMLASGVALLRSADPGLLKVAVYSVFLFCVTLFLLVATPANI